MFFKSILLLLCVAFSGGSVNDGIISEHVDLIELNHFFDRQGKHVYDQVIFFERAPETGRYVVRAWCLVEDREALSRRPERDLARGTVQVLWYDSDQKVLRKIHSELYRESWTQVDPERSNKKMLDERYRTSLVQSNYRYRSMELQNQRLAENNAEPTGSGTSNELTGASPVVANRR